MATATKKRKVDKEGRRFQEKWKYEYFFTEIRNSCVCLICRETVAVFKEFNIKRHYQTKHASYDKLTGDKRGETLKQLEADLTAQQRHFTRARESSVNTTKAGYEVAMLIARHCKPLTEGDFIKECVMKMVEKICPEKKQEFASVCLTPNSVAENIKDASLDIKRQLQAKGAEFDFFSLACYENMDESDTALIFLRGVDSDMNISEELLDLQSLDKTRGADLFLSLCSAVDDMKLQWSKVTGVITDGAPAIAGLSTLVCDKVTEEGGEAIKLNCIFHQEVLCAKHLKYDHVMKAVMNVINYIHTKALCHHQFLLDIQAEYGDVVYHNNTKWLTRGSALQRFCSLREEIRQFLDKKGRPMPELSDAIWLSDLGFLVDITRHLNALNTSLQGQNALVSQLYSHIKAFRTKLLLFQRHLSQAPPNTTHFPSLQEMMSSFPHNNISAQTRRYAAEISSLAEDFQERLRDFAAVEKDITLFSSPFSADPDAAPHRLQLELIEMQCDDECRSRHQQLPLVNFYRQLDEGRFQEIRTFAKRMLSLFGSTYLCEKTFSVMNITTRDSHLRDVLRIRTSVFEPELDHILQSRAQCQPSL